MKFTYADDAAILVTSGTLAENSSILFYTLGESRGRSQAENITFDLANSELLLWSWRREEKDSRTTPSINYENMAVSENFNHPYTMWLGVTSAELSHLISMQRYLK